MAAAAAKRSDAAAAAAAAAAFLLNAKENGAPDEVTEEADAPALEAELPGIGDRRGDEVSTNKA